MASMVDMVNVVTIITIVTIVSIMTTLPRLTRLTKLTILTRLSGLTRQPDQLPRDPISSLLRMPNSGSAAAVYQMRRLEDRRPPTARPFKPALRALRVADRAEHAAPDQAMRQLPARSWPESNSSKEANEYMN